MARKRKNRQRKSKAILGIFIFILLAFAAALTIFVVTLPDVEKLKGSIKIDRNVNKGDSYVTIPYIVGEKNKDFVPLQSISEHLIHAVLVAEDIEFFNHHGFNLKEIEESIKKNIKRKRFARGGSTITQQLMKNVYLSGEKTFFRKFKEAVLAYKAEHSLSKERILELYLNVIEWGEGTYGIRQASSHYFGKEPGFLSLTESVYLAVLIPSPQKYSKAKQGSKLEAFLKKRQDTILWFMEKAGCLAMDEGKQEEKQNKIDTTTANNTPTQSSKEKITTKRETQKELKPNIKKEDEEELFKTLGEFQPEEAFKEEESSKTPSK